MLARYWKWLKMPIDELFKKPTGGHAGKLILTVIRQMGNHMINFFSCNALMKF